MGELASLPEPPYYAVIFTSRRRSRPGDGYGEAADRMEALAAEQPGYLGIETVQGRDGVGVTVSYWTDLDSIAAWKANAEHAAARERGRAEWYEAYELRVARVERSYGFTRDS
jgi:heme-degrading monooxygenase HmoA